MSHWFFRRHFHFNQKRIREPTHDGQLGKEVPKWEHSIRFSPDFNQAPHAGIFEGARISLLRVSLHKSRQTGESRSGFPDPAWYPLPKLGAAACGTF